MTLKTPPKNVLCLLKIYLHKNIENTFYGGIATPP